MKYLWYIIVIPLFALNAAEAQSYKSELASGNQSFGVKNYTKAEQLYRKASAKDKQNTGSLYNKANSIYRMQSMNEAVASYQTALKSARTKEDKHRIFHNMGNALMKQKNYGGAAEAYKNALRNNPHDEQTRYNYALAKKMQKENPDQDKNNKDNKQNKDQNNNKDQNDQNKKDQDKKDENKNGDDQKDKDNKKDQEKQNRQNEDGNEGDKPKPDPREQKQAQSRQQMENMLKALDHHEQGVRERIQGREQKGKPVTSPTTKDW